MPPKRNNGPTTSEDMAQPDQTGGPGPASDSEKEDLHSLIRSFMVKQQQREERQEVKWRHLHHQFTQLQAEMQQMQVNFTPRRGEIESSSTVEPPAPPHSQGQAPLLSQAYRSAVGVVEHAPYPVVLGRDVPTLLDLLPHTEKLAEVMVVTRSQRELITNSEFWEELPYASSPKTKKSRRERRREKIKGTVINPRKTTFTTSWWQWWDSSTRSERECLNTVKYTSAMPPKRNNGPTTSEDMAQPDQTGGPGPASDSEKEDLHSLIRSFMVKQQQREERQEVKWRHLHHQFTQLQAEMQQMQVNFTPRRGEIESSSTVAPPAPPHSQGQAPLLTELADAYITAKKSSWVPNRPPRRQELPVCHACGQKGHKKPNCPTRRMTKNSFFVIPVNDGDNTSSKTKQEAVLQVKIGRKMFTALIDTGQAYRLAVGVVEHAPYPVVLGRDVPTLLDLLPHTEKSADVMVVTRSQRFGMTTPATAGGKIFLIFYGLIGCAATILFFNLFLERIITVLAFVLKSCHEVKRRRKGVLPHSGHARVHREDSLAGWKPSVYCVMLILCMAAIIISCCASAMYSTIEGWAYLDSLYFCFVAFSTIGFGDMVSSQRASYENQSAYRVVNFLFILMGVCCIYSLFNVISIIIKQVLNWLLKKLKIPCRHCPRRPLRPRRNAVMPSRLRTQVRNISIDTDAVNDSETDGRRLSGEMISMRDFLAANKVNLAIMQKQLSETANGHPRASGSTNKHNGFSGGVGALGIMNNRLAETSVDR
ncbi:hypothetical protein DNTS_024219 [Danionella cerebrum]|uniref:CCHC-type domain-containing protein n=1 Tax=Danionella cerebrum TaxID=2873325 RepID=A0A553N2Y2_9TELE|nr:hypothetical protein DNTS_024219 [Danionella translucida]